jgi:hypothetical protein
MVRLGFVRSVLALALASHCVACETEEAPVVVKVPARDPNVPVCPSRRDAATYGPLTIDFEAMARPDTSFELAALYTTITQLPPPAPRGSSQLVLRPGHDDSSKRSLLSLFRSPGGGSLNIAWFGCLDVTSRSGLSFFAKGSPAVNKVRLVPAVPVTAMDSPNLPVTEEWQKFSYSWAALCLPEAAKQGCPPLLVGISFFETATADMSDTWLAIDDLSFDP